MIRATIVWASLLVVGLSATSPDVLAQGSQTGSVTGTIRDATGAVLSGVAVTLSSPNMIGGAQTLTTARDGEYRFTALPAGTYEITAGLQGFRMVKNRAIRLPAGAILTVDFELQVAGVSDVVTVSGGSPMVNVKSSSTPTVIDQEMLFNLPTNRSVANIINLTPGVSADVSFGGSQKSNALFVEGLSTTESLFQNPYTRLNYNWVQEVQVVGLGAGAEYGGFTGVAANSILRSGSNKFSGLAEYWTSRPSWVGRNTGSLSEELQQNFSPRQILSWWDSSTQLGGPIVQDRLWFFSGLQYAAHNDTPAGFSGPGSRDERDLQFLAKFTVALSPNVRLEAFSETGWYDVDGEYVDRSTPIESSNVVSQPQKNWNARLTWVVNPRTSLEVRHSGFVSSWFEEPRPPNTRSGPSPRWDSITQRLSGGPWNYIDDNRREQASSATITHFADRFLGRSHELKFGAEFETTKVRQEWGYPGGRIYWDYAGEPYAVSLLSSDGAPPESGTRRGVLFAQDTWAVNGRVTISPGVRLELNRASVPSKGTLLSTNPVSPRIGLAWDVRGDHRTVVKAHYGRYHDAIFASRIMSADPGGGSSTYALVLGPNQFLPLSTYKYVGWEIDQNLRQSYVSQYVVGVERELFTDFSISGQYIRRNFDTFMGLIDTGSIYAPVQRRDPGQDGRLGTSDDGDFLTVYNRTNPGNEHLLYTNPEQAFNRYNALQFVARKRYSHNWQMQASYTWSRNEGTVGNRWHVNAARFDLGSPGRFVNPNTFINAFGRATFDPTHEVKLLGTGRVSLWGGFSVSGVYRYTTGQAWGRRANIVGLQQGQERGVRLEPQGTRRLPAINRLDFRVEKTFATRRHGGTVGLFFDTFNLSNQGVPDSDITDAVNSFSGSTFGQPTRWVDPRLLRAGLRFSF